MHQPDSSSGQPAGPLRLPAPAPVRAAVKFMYAGTAVSAVGPPRVPHLRPGHQMPITSSLARLTIVDFCRRDEPA